MNPDQEKEANNYIDENDNVTQDYRDDVKNQQFANLPEALFLVGRSKLL